MKLTRSLWFVPAVLAVLASGCDDKALEQVPGKGAGAVGGLSAEQAAKVLAVAGDKTITLGDFMRTLERMDPFDRLRYQTKERRRELLQEMINVELLAQEARRRGLDKRPDVEDALRQIYRDALLQKVRDTLPPPSAISAAEVKAYYDANAERFTEPERRRVSAIVMTDKSAAEGVLKQAQNIKSATEWGELVGKNSIIAKKKGPGDPVDLAGDLGIVGPPGDKKGGNKRVPEPVREAVFKIASVGLVAGDLIEAEGKYFVVRLSGLTAGHTRSLQEADRTIRVAILQQKLSDLEKKLDDELRAKLTVEVDDNVLGSIKLPDPLVDAATSPSPWSAKKEDAPSPAPSEEAPPPGDNSPDRPDAAP